MKIHRPYKKATIDWVYQKISLMVSGFEYLIFVHPIWEDELIWKGSVSGNELENIYISKLYNFYYL